MPETPENHKPDRNDKPALTWPMGGKKVIHMDACSNVFEPCCVGKFKPGTGSGPFLLWRCGPSWFSLPKPCALGPAHWSELSPAFPSVLPASVASGNNVLLSIFYLKHLDSQLLFFNCGDWTSPNYYLILPDTPVWLYGHHCSQSLQERPKLHIRCNQCRPPNEATGVKPEDSPTLKTGPLQWSQITNGVSLSDSGM